MPVVSLSVAVITRNERSNIAACLESVAFADEWIVVDSGSTDGTVEVARSLGATVVQTDDWPGFGHQKNRALSHAKGEWVLSIDADERVTPELKESILAALSSDKAGTAYEFRRLSRFCGQWIRHGDWYPDQVTRLFRRGHGRFSDDQVHERLLIEGRTECLQGHLLHETMPTLDDALSKMNRYSTGRAIDKVQAGQTGSLTSAISHGAWAFCRSYFVRLGLLDGRLGFVLALYIAEGTYYRYLKMAALKGSLGRSGEPS
jgi:glycosyltransferase involved in cell wall biosynthesis